MFEQFSKEEVRILKKICENPIFKQSRPLHVEKISDMKKLKLLICEKYNIKLIHLEGINKDATNVKARKEFINIAYKELGKTVNQIAASINKTHANIYYHLKKPSPETDALLQTFNDSNE